MVEAYEKLPKIDHRPEVQRVNSFRESILGGLAIRPMLAEVDVEDFDSEKNAIRNFMDIDYRFESSLYVPPEMFPELGGQIIDFEPMTSRGKSSRHGVFFGFLILEDGSELPVAVKPHAMNEDTYSSKREADASCLKDYFTNSAAQKCGFESLEAVGVVLNSESHAYMITVLDDDLTTLESIDWRRCFEPGYENAGMLDILRKSASLSGLIHATGDSYHGDRAPRNEGINVYGQLKGIDWEDGHITKAPSRDIEERFGKSLVDMWTHTVATLSPRSAPNPGLGVFERLQATWWSAYKEAYFDHYADVRLSLASQGSHHMRRYKDTKTELQQLESTLKSQVEGLERVYTK